MLRQNDYRINYSFIIRILQRMPSPEKGFTVADVASVVASAYSDDDMAAVKSKVRRWLDRQVDAKNAIKRRTKDGNHYIFKDSYLNSLRKNIK